MGFHERISHEQAWSGRREPGTQDGHDFEKAFLGQVILKNEEQSDYLAFNDAIEFAKGHQPDILDRPQLIKDLRIKIANLANQNEAVHFYTAVGTPLDTYHGVDGFFEQGDRRVTIDVSLREKSSYKADVLIVGALDEEGNVAVSDEELSLVAAQIAAKLQGAPTH